MKNDVKFGNISIAISRFNTNYYFNDNRCTLFNNVLVIFISFTFLNNFCDQIILASDESPRKTSVAGNLLITVVAFSRIACQTVKWHENVI